MEELFVESPIELFRNSAVITVYLFGSRAAGTATDKSDYDIAIVTDARFSIDKNIFLKSLTTLFRYPEQLDVSFVDLKNSAPLLLFQIIKTGQLLYERKPKEHIELESLIMRMYYHDQHRLNIFYQNFKERYVN